MKTVEIQYIESGTFIGGEEDAFTVGIKSGEMCAAIKQTDLAQLLDDQARLDWLEQTARGSGPHSRFVKSIFICAHDGEKIALDVKTESVVIANGLRAAIDKARAGA